MILLFFLHLYNNKHFSAPGRPLSFALRARHKAEFLIKIRHFLIIDRIFLNYPLIIRKKYCIMNVTVELKPPKTENLFEPPGAAQEVINGTEKAHRAQENGGKRPSRYRRSRLQRKLGPSRRIAFGRRHTYLSLLRGNERGPQKPQVGRQRPPRSFQGPHLARTLFGARAQGLLPR